MHATCGPNSVLQELGRRTGSCCSGHALRLTTTATPAATGSRPLRVGGNRRQTDRLVTSESASRASYRASRIGRRGLEVRCLSYQLDPGRVLVSDICFTARPGTVTAVIGTSGAGKTTLAKLVSGALAPTIGMATLDGHDVHGDYASLRSRIAMVPQDDLVHGQLTVRQALT